MTYRNIDTSIWKDDWFLDLQTDEKLLFIYLFSNENTFLTGLYKISLRVIEFETGLSKEFICNTLDKFSDANKIHYQGGVIWVVNLKKYNDSKSPKVAARVAWELKQIPECELKELYLHRNDTVSKPIYSVPGEDNRVSIEYGYSIDTDSTLTIQTKPNQTNPATTTVKSFSKFQNEIGMLTPLTSEMVTSWIDDYSDEWTSDAIDEAVKNNVRKPAYIDKILTNWKANGRNGKKPAPAFIPEDHASEVY